MRAAALLLALVLGLAAAPGSAQPPAQASSLDALLGKPIAEVRFVVAGQQVEEPGLAGALETRPGTPLTRVAVRRSLLIIISMNRFSDVTADAELTPAGVVLSYELVRLQTVTAIEFRGDLGLSSRQLRTAVLDRYGASPPAWRGDEIARMLETECRDHGYLTAAVSAKTEPAPGQDLLRLVFDMKAGPQATVGESHVEGAPDGQAPQVLARLGAIAGARFDRVALDQAVERYVADLRTQGFLEARIDTDVVPSADRRRVSVAVRMTRGPAVAVTFRGDPLPDKRRKEILALMRGGTLDEDLLENQERSIENDLRAEGYRNAVAPFTRESGPDDRLQVVFTVTRGLQYRVAAVDLVGDHQVSRVEVLPVLKVAPGEWYVKAKLDDAAAAVQLFYRLRGFRTASVKVTAAPTGTDPSQLAVTFDVTEGPRTTIDAIDFEGVSAVQASDLRQIVGSKVDGPYYQPQVEVDRESVLARYLALGYLQATVTVPEAFSVDATRFSLRFVVHEGPQILIGHVLIRGNIRTKFSTIDRAVGLKAGMPLTMSEVVNAQLHLSELGLFRKVQVTQLDVGELNRRDILVTVEEAPVNTIGYGGGLEGTQVLRPNPQTGIPEQVIEISPRGFFEIGRRNMWGKDRSVDLFLRGAIRSTDQVTTTGSSTTVTSSSGFHEYRVLATYREPRFLELPVDVVVSGSLEQAIRSTFDFNRQQMYVEGSHRFGRKLSVAGRYALGRTRLFNEQIAPADELAIDRLFPQVRLSTLSASAIFSTRDDAFDPTRGILLSFDTTVAPRALGSEVGFIRGSWQSFVYKRVPWLPGAVFAGGARLGLAFGFPLAAVDANGEPIVIEQELPASERFFAGGDTSVRGWALDQLGASNVIDVNGVSNGGNGLVIFNAELRFPLWRARSLGGAVFIDTGNVFATVSEISLADLRSGAGFGIRWKSPVGPLRLDFAWKLKPITYGNGTRENRFAWYITIGQAF
jgi:outer membrane protein insertion porin family